MISLGRLEVLVVECFGFDANEVWELEKMELHARLVDGISTTIPGPEAYLTITWAWIRMSP